jgi:hypothetical protein
MRQKLTTLAGILFLAVIIGCATSSTAYKTLATVENLTVLTYTEYLQGVVAGTFPTNSVPSITRDFNLFQSSMQETVAIASQGSASPSTQPINVASTALIAKINAAKGGAQ